MDVYDNIGDISDSVRKDIDRGIGILKAGGCEAVFLFGSVVEGRNNSRSDIDFAVRGCPAGMFYRLQGKLPPGTHAICRSRRSGRRHRTDVISRTRSELDPCGMSEREQN